MFSTDFIFISITLIILLIISYKIGSPKVATPLILIYMFLIFKNLLNFNNQENPNATLEEKQHSNQIQKVDKVKNDNKSLNEQKTPNKISESQKKSKSIKSENILKEKKPEDLKEKKAKKLEKNDQVNIQKLKKKANDKKKKKSLDNLLSLKEIKICKNIKNRNPIGIGEIFSNSVDSLYCFTKIENLGKKMEVRHVWYYENQIMTQVRYNVKKSNVYRSWTKKTISPFQIGNWRVEVQDHNGTIIGSKGFKIKKSS